MADPAPHRDRVALGALCFGIAAAPLAWSAQLLFTTALAGSACYPHAYPLAAPLWRALSPALLAITAAAFAFAVSGGGVAWHAWRLTRTEHPGTAHHLMETGNGRTRFMAMCGLLISGVFVIALAFGATALSMVPLCDR